MSRSVHPSPDGELQDLTLAQLLVCGVAGQQLPQLSKGSTHILLPKSFSKQLIFEQSWQLSGSVSQYLPVIRKYFPRVSEGLSHRLAVVGLGQLGEGEALVPHHHRGADTAGPSAALTRSLRVIKLGLGVEI